MRAVLTFHAVDASGSVLSFPPEGLRRLVRGLRRDGHAVVPLEQLLDEPDAADRVALCFDDGMRSVCDAALPVLRDEGATATLFLTTGAVGKDNGWPGQPEGIPRLPMLSWPQVEALHAAGWAVEAHTVHHPDLRLLDDAALEAELVDAADEIEQRLGRRPRAFAYPYGFFDERVAERVGRHYATAFTTRMAPLDAGGVERLRVPRLDSYYLRPRWLQGRAASPWARRWLELRRRLRAWRAGA